MSVPSPDKSTRIKMLLILIILISILLTFILLTKAGKGEQINLTPSDEPTMISTGVPTMTATPVTAPTISSPLVTPTSEFTIYPLYETYVPIVTKGN